MLQLISDYSGSEVHYDLFDEHDDLMLQVHREHDRWVFWHWDEISGWLHSYETMDEVRDKIRELYGDFEETDYDDLEESWMQDTT